MSCGSEAVLSNTQLKHSLNWLNKYPNKYQKLHFKSQILIFFIFSASFYWHKFRGIAFLLLQLCLNRCEGRVWSGICLWQTC